MRLGGEARRETSFSSKVKGSFVLINKANCMFKVKGERVGELLSYRGKNGYNNLFSFLVLTLYYTLL